MPALPEYRRLRALLDYDDTTGIFSWRKPTSNRVKSGDVANCQDKAGYVVIRIDGALHKAHRLAWLYYYGSAPCAYIDHIDMDKSNNRISNLRLATKAQNQANVIVRNDSRLGVKGVYFDAKRNKYQVKIRRQHIGRFNTLPEAIDAYKTAACIEFGEFART